MLQHSSKLTREGWLYERELLREFLVENKPPAFIRKQNKDLVDSGKRKFKIKSRNGLPVINKTTWTKTILDIRTENAEVYCEDVNAWARSVLEDVKELEVYEYCYCNNLDSRICEFTALPCHIRSLTLFGNAFPISVDAQCDVDRNRVISTGSSKYLSFIYEWQPCLDECI